MKKLLTFLIIILTTGSLTQVAKAEEIVISGNGSESSNQVSSNADTQTTVTQENSAQITNNIDINASSGGNSASENTGEETSISTGDVNVDAQLTTAANVSTVDLGCCPHDGIATISDNGEASQNQISANFLEATNISINQNANVDNNLAVNADSGSNQADRNSGNVTISTGDVKVATNIRNTNINIFDVNSPILAQRSFQINISGNAANSNSKIDLSLSEKFEVFINNLASIVNVLDVDANSGRNAANGNSDDVTITTGDVQITSDITNEGVNLGSVDISCCPDEDSASSDDPPKGGKEDNSPPSQSGTSSGGGGPSPGGGGGSSGGPGQVLGAAVGQILPATGSFWIVILTLISMIMFLMGLYLRLHPGQDPGLKYVYC